MIWLKLAITNLGRAPNTLRMDLGIENVYCEELQVSFIKNSDSFLYAASTRNQRIEAFWSWLKKFNLSWWIDSFTDLIKCRIYNPGSEFHREALIFSFMLVTQAQLNDFARIWNIREIRKSLTSPGGVPEILFNAPSTVGFDKKGYSVDDLDLRVAQDIIGIDQHPICKNDEMHELFICYINIYKLEVPRDPEDAITIYVKILECLEQDGFQI